MGEVDVRAVLVAISIWIIAAREHPPTGVLPDRWPIK
jgi:hypothetical protein